MGGESVVEGGGRWRGVGGECRRSGERDVVSIGDGSLGCLDVC